MIITIAGSPGSGKTSAGKFLAERLGMPFLSVGGLRAKMALDRGITIDELNRLGESDKSTDTNIDEYQRQLGEEKDDFVIEGRLSWHFIPYSFKIFLSCNPHEAARRIFAAQHSAHDRRPDEALYETVEAAEVALAARVASDVKRYATIYNLDYRDPSNYDLVIDTTDFSGPEITAERMEAAVKAQK